MDKEIKKILVDYIQRNIRDENLENKRIIMSFEITRMIYPLLLEVVNQEHMEILRAYNSASIIDTVQLQVKENDCCYRAFKMNYEYEDSRLPHLYRPSNNGSVKLILLVALESEKRASDDKMREAYMRIVSDCPTMETLGLAWPKALEILADKKVQAELVLEQAIIAVQMNESARSDKKQDGGQ